MHKPNVPEVGSPRDICVRAELAGSRRTCCVCETSVPPPCRSEEVAVVLCVVVEGASPKPRASDVARVSWVSAIATFLCWILSPGSWLEHFVAIILKLINEQLSQDANPIFRRKLNLKSNF